MVLPAPVGPTMAMVWPGSTLMFMSCMSGRVFLVTEADMTRTGPCPSANLDHHGIRLLGDFLGSSRISNTRSAEARVDCRTCSYIGHVEASAG